MGFEWDPGSVKVATKKIVVFFRFIRIEHTLFSLPFAYIGSFLALRDLPTLYQFLVIGLAVFGARTGGMAMNNFADRKIDSLNPRTKNRPTATGMITARDTLLFVIFGYGIFEISAFMLNKLSFELSPFVLIFGILYPYTKRFTSLSHLFLGINNGVAPVGGWVAVTNSLNPIILILFLAITLWVAGFDIIYSYMDLEFDMNNKLHSFPVMFGDKAIYLSISFHALTILLFFFFYLVYLLNLYYLLFIIAILILIIYQHYLVYSNKENIPKAFNINLYVAVLFFFSIIFGVFL